MNLSLRTRLILSFIAVVAIDFVPLVLLVQIVPGILEGPTYDDYSCIHGLFFQNCQQYDKPGYWFAAVGLLLVVVASWLVAAYVVLAPLRAIAGAIGQLGPQNLGHRIRLRAGRQDPLKRISDELDGVLDRLSAGYESQLGFAANASHELRTPLAVQRTLIEVAMEAPEQDQDLRQLGRTLLAANERNERLIEGLLVLAEVERRPAGRVPIPLDRVVAEVLATHQEFAQRHEVELRPFLTDRLVPGDAILLERMVVNLIRNAVLYNEPGGWVEVIISESPALLIRNSGEHVPAETVPTLFEPFRRGGQDRTTRNTSGAGLGLSIVRSIVAAHDGRVQATAQPEGGLAVSVWLPMG